MRVEFRRKKIYFPYSVLPKGYDVPPVDQDFVLFGIFPLEIN